MGGGGGNRKRRADARLSTIQARLWMGPLPEAVQWAGREANLHDGSTCSTCSSVATDLARIAAALRAGPARAAARLVATLRRRLARQKPTGSQARTAQGDRLAYTAHLKGLAHLGEGPNRPSETQQQECSGYCERDGGEDRHRASRGSGQECEDEPSGAERKQPQGALARPPPTGLARRLSFAKTRSWHWTSGWHRATLGRNVPRTRSLGRRACSAQDPYQSRAGEPGAPAATRSAPPPLEATAVRAPRSRVLGLALSAVGRPGGRRSKSFRPETVIRWHRQGFRAFLTWKSRRGRTGRPPIGSELAHLIRTVAHANPFWGARRIHGELLKLGLEVSQRTVARLMPRRPKPPSQTWRTFLQTHVVDLVSVDFFVVPTATFRVLYVFVVLLQHRRQVVHFNVTDFPTAAWTAQQIVEAFPDDSAPRYLLRDRDGIYGGEFRRQVGSRA